MAIINIPFVFSAGNTIIASQHNANFSTIANLVNGSLDTTNLSASAAIAYSQLVLTGSIVNADISSAAAIATSKINFGTTHQGDIFVDNGSGITRLTPGTSGQFLKTQGASANAIWTTLQLNFVPNNIQVFVTSGTWTQPAGITSAYVKVIGAGGSGGSGATGASGGGGGGGGYAEGVIAVSGNVTVTIGATNSFAGTTTIQATAGSNGSGATPGAGGVGSNGTLNLTGATGQGGSSGVTGAFGGCGGGSAMGPGGGGGAGGNNAGSAGGQYGGGGGGGGASASNPSGGAANVGAVIVYY